MFHEATVETLALVFDRAVATGVLPPAVVRSCEVDWFHQFILGGTYRLLRAGEPAKAREVFALLALPRIRELGRSRRWYPVRLLFRALIALPAAISGPMMRLVGRFNPERIWMPL
jgi:hypothetical protein